MKLTTKDLALIAITAIITATAVFAITTFWDQGDTVPPPSGPGASERVTWEYAKNRMNEYLRFDPLFVQYTTPPSGTKIIDTLEGFVFDATDLLEIISSNASRLGNPNEIIFYLGQEGKFIDLSTNPPIERADNLSLIAIGMKDKNLLLDVVSAGRQVSLFDKADPCPPNCPN